MSTAHSETVQIRARLYQAIEDMLPAIAARAPQAKAERRVPAQSIAELKSAGFFRVLLPRQYGGYELDPQDFFRLQMRIAEGCMSTAWAGGIIAVHAFQIALMDKRAQDDVYGQDPDTLVSSAYAPVGKVEIVEGGFRLSGRWGWSSGSDHCTWALLGAIVPGEGYRTFLVPRTDYVVEDTWQVMGLEGTGSNDIVVKDAFVPDYRTHKQLDGFNLTNPGVTADSHPMYRIPWGQLFVRTVCTSAIGACKTALKLYVDGVRGSASSDLTKLAGDTETQMRVAAAANTIDEVETILFRNFDRMLEQVTTGEEIPLLDRVKYRYQSSLVIEKCLSVVDALFAVAGGRSVFLGSEIQQRFQDIHTARAHVANNPTAFARNYGAMLLGMDNKDVFV